MQLGRPPSATGVRSTEAREAAPPGQAALPAAGKNAADISPAEPSTGMPRLPSHELPAVDLLAGITPALINITKQAADGRQERPSDGSVGGAGRPSPNPFLTSPPFLPGMCAPPAVSLNVPDDGHHKTSLEGGTESADACSLAAVWLCMGIMLPRPGDDQAATQHSG